MKKCPDIITLQALVDGELDVAAGSEAQGSRMTKRTVMKGTMTKGTVTKGTVTGVSETATGGEAQRRRTVSGTLSEGELYGHLNECSRCREVYEELGAAVELAAGLAVDDALPAGLREKILAAVPSVSDAAGEKSYGGAALSAGEGQAAHSPVSVGVPVSPYPAGLIAGFLFSLLLSLSLVAGLFTIDALFFVHLMQNVIAFINHVMVLLFIMSDFGPTPWLVAVLLVVAVEIMLLIKIKSLDADFKIYYE